MGGSRGKKRRRGYGASGFEEWGGYMAAKVAKLQDQFQKEAVSTGGEERVGIFKDIAIFVNGYTEPTAEELKRLMMANGGIFHHYYSRTSTTHIIASNLPDTKIKNMNLKRIVCPKWITESLDAGKLLDYTNYCLYTNASKRQPLLNFQKLPKTSAENGKNLSEKEFKEELPKTSVEDGENSSGKEFKESNSDESLIISDTSEKQIDQNPMLSESPDMFEDDDMFSTEFLDCISHSLDSENNREGCASMSKPVDSANAEIPAPVLCNSDDGGKCSSSESRITGNAVTKLPTSASNLGYLPKNITSPVKGSAMNTSNPNFLSEFYNNSRLHYISTMGAMFKNYVNEIQNKKENYSGRERLKEWMQKSKMETLDEYRLNSVKSKRTVMHIDMDCFFVSVGLRNYPELKGKPVAVTHARGNSNKVKNIKTIEYEMEHYANRSEKNRQRSSKGGTLSSIKELNETDSIVPDGDKSTEKESSVNSKQDRIFGSAYDQSVSRKFVLLDGHSSCSEIASCNYEARKAGVRNGMYLGAALKLCPELQPIPYDFDGYKEVSFKLYDIVASYTHDIEAVSCDEMFIDCTEVLQECKASPLEFAACLREEVQVATKCPCSAGIGPNILLARMATRLAKPNGQHYLAPDCVLDFMRDQKVNELPGVGRNMNERLEGLGILTCGDLQDVSLTKLQSEFGHKSGQSLYNYCRGIDNRQLKNLHQRKSVSAEVNYGIRFTGWQDAERFITELSAEVENRLQSINTKGKCITVKLKIRAKGAPVEAAKFMGHGVCDNVARSATLASATSSASVICRESLALLRQVHVPPQEFRGIGIQVSRLEIVNKSSLKKISSAEKSSIKTFLLAAKPKRKLLGSDDHEVQEQERSADSNTDSDIKAPSTESIKNKNVISHQSPEAIVNSEASTHGLSGINIEADIRRTSASPEVTTDKPKPMIDADVLSALPADIREQVIEEYKQQGYAIPSQFSSVNPRQRKECERSDSLVDFESPKPGPSRLVTRDDTEPPISHGGELGKPVSDPMDISFSQVDASFLAALPDDIRADLQRDLKRNKQESQAPFMIKSGSGTKKSKDRRGKSGKRGRPRKTDYKSVVGTKDKSIEKQPLPSSVMEDRNMCKNESPQDSVQNEIVQVPEEEPNLCGVVKVNEVKSLIQEWVISCERPEEEDRAILAKYYTSLVLHHNLELLDVLIKFLHRKVNSTQNAYWQYTYRAIVQEVQKCMVEIYKVQLKVTDI
ncbi:rev1 DNA directed polymerase isoform X2 [Oratosquilla oratoria]|uniref:rev1 DNA directed polymerase isoform X2 n=1 Tax=Oratosquilla oratoria TaxID=337810 RepID=UPI003F7586A8